MSAALWFYSRRAFSIFYGEKVVSAIYLFYICNQSDSIMEAPIQKKATMFRLSAELIERLKVMAKREHRSLNNFVECILLDVAYNEPNDVTKSAIEEARSGKLRDVPAVDTTSAEAMFKSMGL